MERLDVLIVGAGQAGLSLSRELSRAGVEHAVLERGRIGEGWRGRWDSFCLVTPNWSIQLPDGHYDGDDPDGYLPRDEIAAYLERYAASFDAPVREGVDVTAMETSNGGFVVETAAGPIQANRVVLACGAYQSPHRPPGSARIPAATLQLDVAGYRNPQALPDGAVLIIGSSQSGCQIAEELHHAGRRVVVACGRAPWLPRRIGGRDGVWWAVATGFLDQPVEVSAGCRTRGCPIPRHSAPTHRDGCQSTTWHGVLRRGLPTRLSVLAALARCLRRPRLPHPPRGREHRRTGPPLHRRPFSFASASRRCWSASARTPRSSPPASLTRPPTRRAG